MIDMVSLLIGAYAAVGAATLVVTHAAADQRTVRGVILDVAIAVLWPLASLAIYIAVRRGGSHD